MDPISITCPNCSAHLTIRKPQLIGARINCPKCKTPFIAKAPEEPDLEAPDLAYSLAEDKEEPKPAPSPPPPPARNPAPKAAAKPRTEPGRSRSGEPKDLNGNRTRKPKRSRKSKRSVSLTKRLKKWWPALVLLVIGLPVGYYVLVNVVWLKLEIQRRIDAGILDAGFAGGISSWDELEDRSQAFQAYRGPDESEEPAEPSSPQPATTPKQKPQQAAEGQSQRSGSSQQQTASSQVAANTTVLTPQPVEPAEMPRLRQRPLDLTYLPQNTDLIISVRVSDLFDAPAVKNLLASDDPMGQPAVDQMVNEFGVAPGEIETLVVGVTGLSGSPTSAPPAPPTTSVQGGAVHEMPMNTHEGPVSPSASGQSGGPVTEGETVVVVHTLAPYDEQKVLSTAVDGEPLQHSGSNYYPLKNRLGKDSAFLYLPTPQTLVMGSEGAIQSAITRGRRSPPLPAAMRFLNANYHLSIGIFPKDASLFGAASAFAPDAADQGLSSALAQHAAAVGISLHATDSLVGELVVRCRNRAGAEQVAQAADQALAALRQNAAVPSGADPMGTIAAQILSSTSMKQNGPTVAITAAVPPSAFEPQNLGPAMMPLMMSAAALTGGNPLAGGGLPGGGIGADALSDVSPADEEIESIAAREPRSGPPRVIIDLTKGGFSWWSPQSGPQFDPDQPHRGTAVVKYFQERDWPVRELADDADLLPALLEADIAIRFGDTDPHTPEEVDAYDRFVQSGGALLLLAGYRVVERDDPLTEAFGIRFSGRINGGIIREWADRHPVTRRLEGVAIPLASEVAEWPDSATILGSIAGEGSESVVLGALEHGHGTVVFLSCESLLFEMPQPLTDRMFDFLSGDLKVESPSQRATVLSAKRIDADFQPDADLTKDAWSSATPVRIERETIDGTMNPELATTVRALWSDQHLYLAFEAPFTELTTAQRPNIIRERRGLSDNKVVQAFISGSSRVASEYYEFQVSPDGEWADSAVKDFGDEIDLYWNSGFEKVAKIDQHEKVWTAVMRIPLSQVSTEPPESGTRWRINLFRIDRANDALLAWNPTRNENLYESRRFGTLVFED